MVPYPNYILCLSKESSCPNCNSRLSWIAPEKSDDWYNCNYPLFQVCFNCNTVTVIPPKQGNIEAELQALPNDLQSVISEPFIKLLNYQDEEIRQHAIRVLSLIGTPVIPELANLLAKHIKVTQRKAIVEVLGKIKDERAVEVLLEALARKDTYSEARVGLERLGKIAFEPIQKVLRNPKSTSRLRGKLLSVLCHSGGLTDVEQIIEALENQNVDADVRMWAARKLGEFQNEHILGILMRADKREWHPEVHAYIKESIGKIKLVTIASLT